jgi:aspartate-semialdehyde dehydrogenase
MDSRVPIVVPEINPGAINDAKLGIIAKPNCTTTIGALVLHYLDQEVGLVSLDVDTYQADSGQGQPGLNEHDRLARLLIERGDEIVHGQREPYPEHEIYPVIPVFNPSPVAGVFEDDSDHTTEELKYKNETRKIFERTSKNLPIDVTCARTGGYNCHALSIHAEFEDKITADQADKILYESEGIQLHGQSDIPQPIYVAGTDPVHVGRIRQSERFGKHGLKFWAVADNLRKGAALNDVQILELLADKEELGKQSP